MRLVVSKDEISLYELDSESELKEYVMANNGAIVGNDIQTKNKFYVVEYLTDCKKNIIGVLNEGHGVMPTVVKLKNADLIVVTSDKSVYFLDANNNEVIKSIICDSLIFDVISRENEVSIFIVCELGIQSLTPKGDKVWVYDCEIISDFALYDDYIELIVEGTEYKISLQNGKVL